MRTFKITDKQLEFLQETKRIRPWTDADYEYTNPTQLKSFDFAKAKELDDEYAEKTGKARQSTNSWRAVSSGPQKERVGKLQSRITDKLQQQFMDQTGSDDAVLKKDFKIFSPEKIAKELATYGMLVQITGKTFSFGNKKLPEDTLIVNLTSAFNCPSKEAGECKWGSTCYAYSGEGRETVLRRNLRNQEFLGMLSTRDILELVETYIESAPIRIRYIRIHEGGDFKDQGVVDFCDKLAGHLKAKYGIKTTAYTHRNLDYSGLENMIVNASSYDIKSGDRYFVCVSKKDWDKLPEGLHFDGQDIPMYSAEDKRVKIDTTHGTYKCYCDCRKCRFCYQTKEDNGEPDGNMISVIEPIH